MELDGEQVYERYAKPMVYVLAVFALLSIVLALIYMDKTRMFILAFLSPFVLSIVVFIGIAVLKRRDVERTLPACIVTAFGMAALTALMLWVLSGM